MLTKILEPGTRLTRNRYAGDVLLERLIILRLLKENYELKQKIEELEKKIAEATAKTEAAETVEKTKLLKQQTVHQLNNFFSFFIRQLQCSMPVYGTII